MRPASVSQTGVGNSTALAHDIGQRPFDCSLATEITGTVNYTIQHTFDNIYDSSVTPVWFNHDNPVFVNATDNANDNYKFPCYASRIVINSGTGTVKLIAIQGNL